MKIAMIDCDNTKFPNLGLMKLSAWHKSKGDNVEWYNWASGYLEPYDICYISKVFSFSQEYDQPIYAKKILRGGQRFCYQDN